ncbi:ferredoxin family protein [Candidatus Bathyarchaeota archaeon]|nr:ferredoxin family protein [Candidatus Bathyarchaeota archaeon]
MSKLYHGVRRDKIPWHPTIDYKTCTNCETCFNYCKLGVYTLVDDKGKNKPIVTNPHNCVMFCTGCEGQCPTEAISFPSKKDTREIIKKLKKTC